MMQRSRIRRRSCPRCKLTVCWWTLFALSSRIRTSVSFVPKLVLFSNRFPTRWNEQQDVSKPIRSIVKRMAESGEGNDLGGQVQPSPSLPNRDFGVNADRLEELRRSIDIVSVIESFELDLFERKSPTRATACCPFHKDKSPSLSVDASRNIYKCFGCGAGGDVFTFVREFAKLKGEGVTYFQSIRRVQDEWGDPNIKVLSGLKSGRLATRNPEEDEKMRQRKERILAANGAAAAYYAACMLQPSAGAARLYVRSRGITASTVAAYRLGYAPGRRSTRHRSTTRDAKALDEDCLVQHLKGLGFTIAEIFDAGLAVEVKGPFSQVMETKAKPNTTSTEANVIDRFRDRLIVPILDKQGTNVIGLGGRIISQPVRASSGPAKYINSPESPVFTKGSTLFGEGAVRDLITDPRRTRNGERTIPPHSLVIVEGYMDAITLWNAGVKEVVASMGASLSIDQLSAAAKLVQAIEGRVVLCLDNDNAGIAAVERLCSNGALKDVSEKYRVEVRVATMPEGIKDPDEYIQRHKGEGNAGQSFVENVVQAAMDWNTWFVDRIIMSYHPEAQRGRIGSFGNVFDRVAEHLATSMSVADRTRFAYNIADSLAGILAAEKNMSGVSDAVRTQLEADLIEESARIASVKDSIKRRTEAAALGKADANVKKALRALMQGDGPTGIEDRVPKQTNSSALTFPRDSTVAARASKLARSSPTLAKVNRVKTDRNLKHRSRTRSDVSTSLTPHFAGIRFVNKSDQDWIANSSPSKSLLSGLSTSYAVAKRRTSDNVVYFNSNQYHGVHYLTEDAEMAGYTRGSFNRDASFVDVGVSALLKPDMARQVQKAEDGLLRTLILHGAARTSLRNLIDARDAVGFSFEVKWSSPAKAWLFETLVGTAVPLPASIQEPSALRAFLAKLPNSPLESLSNDAGNVGLGQPERAHESNDYIEIDRLFDNAEKMSSLLVFDTRLVEFEVQHYHSTLLRAAATMELRVLQKAMDDVFQRMNVRPNSNEEAQSDDGGEIADSESLNAEFRRLAEELRLTSRTLQSLTNASNMAASRQLHASLNARQEGRVSEALQAELAAKLDEHMSNLQSLSTPSERDRYQGSGGSDESVRETLERVESNWGQWDDEDFQWSPLDN